MSSAPDPVARYLTPTPAHYALGLVCLGAGAQQGRLAPVRDRVLDCHAVVLVTAGSGWLSWGLPPVRHEVAAPLVFVLRPRLRHSYGPSPDGWAERWVLFDGTATAAYTDLGYLPNQPPLPDMREVTSVRRAIGRVITACAPGNPNAEVEAAVATHQVLAAIRRARDAAGTGHAEILKTLRAGALRPVPVAWHAHELGMPVAVLRRAVFAAAGCGPREYILRIRLNEAKALLAESTASVTQVAAMTGYEDPAYFSRFFTRRTGLSPSEFRRQHGRATGPGLLT